MSTNGLSRHVQQFLNPEPERPRPAAAQSPYQRLARQMQDLVGDGGILKEVIQPGMGQPVPENASVVYHFSAYLEYSDRPFESNRYQKYPGLMKLGRDVTLWGLEVGLLTMRRGEFSRFLFLPRYAYGPMGCPPLIPPGATVLFEVQLIDFLDSAEVDDFFALSLEQQSGVPLPTVLSVVNTQRSFGNRLFRQSRYEDAKDRYKQAIAVLSNREPADEEEKSQISALKLPVFLNLSLTMMRLQRPARALVYGRRALDISPHHAKALFRCGQAHLEMGDYEEARDFLVQAQVERPFDTDINDLLKKLASCYKDYTEKEKQMCVKMFSSLRAVSEK
ncbi:inactive peptidyl-prolyl cis-trans isomerase FKBP6 [Amia ocellicauda]|uniref:inactive peptidyl-prolyl cis-trans isomerase FKBP6 n=1 Tax=Amia ocellicauda TaxID=2972642 RepID=UPI003464C1D3